MRMAGFHTADSPFHVIEDRFRRFSTLVETLEPPPFPTEPVGLFVAARFDLAAAREYARRGEGLVPVDDEDDDRPGIEPRHR
jgi:hypothetical protein